jgi:hypothetical protein
MIKNNNNFDSLSKNLLNDVRAVLEGKKSCSKDCKCEKCETEEKGEVKEAKKMEGKDPCWKGYEMVGTKKKGGKEVPNCVPEETEYNKDAVDKAIDSSNRSGKKISPKAAKNIHALLKGSQGYAARKEETEVNEITQKLASDAFHGFQDRDRKRFMRGQAPSNKVGMELAIKKIEGTARVPATRNESVEHDTETHKIESDRMGHYTITHKPSNTSVYLQGDDAREFDDQLAKTKGNQQKVDRLASDYHHVMEEADIVEAKKESPIAGTRLISKHEGKNGHHAEVRRYGAKSDPDNEYQVHHYENGKHMGEGPVSYHGSGDEGLEDATASAEYEVKNYRPKGGSLQKEELVGNQHKIDMNKNGELDSQDFKILQGKKKGGGKKWKSTSYKTPDGKCASKDVKEETLEEKLNPSMGAAKYIDDFVKSNDPRFKGKTKPERIKMALGAYYSAKNEEFEQIQERSSGNLHNVYVDGKPIARIWGKDARHAERAFIRVHPEHKNARITVVPES